MGKKICLDGGKMQHPAEAHKHLRTQLRLPGYYGENLDALFDCLTEIGEQTVLEISDWEKIFPPIRKLLHAAAQENDRLTIRKEG